MLRNYVAIALRTLKRDAGYAAINISGLSLGIACCVLLALFARHEWRHDRFHDHAGHLFRLNQTVVEPSGDRATRSMTAAPIASALANALPGVERAVRLSRGPVRLETSGTEDPLDVEAMYADDGFFKAFSFCTRHGEAAGALAVPDGIVLTAKTARRRFGEEQVVGRSLTVRIQEETLEATVAAVIDAPPSHSSLQFDAVLPYSAFKLTYPPSMRELVFERWDISLATTFVQVRPSARLDNVRANLAAFVDNTLRPALSSGEEGGLNVIGPGEDQRTLALQPLLEVHHTPDIASTTLAPARDPVYLYLMSAAAILILLIAGINFTTLALGRSAQRAKEVSVRKTVGAHRGQIRAQFWGEALLTSGGALLLGVLLAAVALPAFGRMTGQTLAFDLTPGLMLGLIGLAGLVGLVTGSYPALVLSRISPASILRGATPLGRSNVLTRSLVVFQFTLSVALVAGSFVMSKQIHFMQDNHGFATDQVVRITELGSTSSGKDIYERFRSEATQLAGVQNIASATFPFFQGGGLTIPLALGDSASIEPRFLPVDANFSEVVGIDVLEGRALDPTRTSDSQAVLVNESFVRAMGWAEPVGRTLDVTTSSSMLGRLLGEVTVVGVVEDVHTQSLRQRVEPLLIGTNQIFGAGVGAVYVRVAGARAQQTYEQLATLWAELVPDRPFEARWFDDVVAEAYAEEQRMQQIVQMATLFALLIACFGLFGMAALATRQRAHEIGVRKVLGASVQSIIGLFSRDVLLLTGIAFALATPLAYVGARRWLETFAYRTALEPWLFVGAGLAVTAVALGTVILQVMRAARLDPVATLRSE